jgi:hypothetical protein
MIRTWNIFIIISVFIFFTGCEESTQSSDYSDQLVVSAFLMAEQPMDSVFISHTGTLFEYYSPGKYAITNAVVKITMVDSVHPSASHTVTLLHDGNHPGRYYSSEKVLPLRTYLLSVEAPGYPVVTGKTSVPDTFSIINRSEFPDTISFNPAAPAHTLFWNASNNYVDYIGAIASMDTAAQDIPSDFRRADDPKPDKTALFIFNSPHTTSVSIIWLAFNYYGRNYITMKAVDYNYYDYLRQYIVSGGTELRQMRYNISNGIGVFGSCAVAHNSFVIYIKP